MTELLGKTLADGGFYLPNAAARWSRCPGRLTRHRRGIPGMEATHGSGTLA